MKMRAEILRAEGLKQRFGKKVALDIPQIGFQENRIFAVVGPNGSGKTTLLEILALLERPSEGKVWLQGEEGTGPDRTRTRLRRLVTLVDQNPFLFDKSVYGNIAFGLRSRGLSRNEVQVRVEEVLGQVGLRGFEERSAPTLSAGEAQRVALARALALRPKVLLLDEPTANVDAFHVQVVESLIRDIREREGITIIFSSHGLPQSYRLADEILLLLKGRLSPASPENHFSGIAVEEKGEWVVEPAPGVRIAIPDARRGKVHFSVAPEDVLLSNRAFSSSARNSFKGSIVEMSRKGNRVQVAVDVGVKIVSAITEKSLEEMGLKVGDTIYLTFKVFSVQLY